jgi:hypothetical protein
MRVALIFLAVLVLLRFTAVDAQAVPPFTVSEASPLLKKMGCGINPENCTWCSKRTGTCYMVTNCHDGACGIWPNPNNPSDAKIIPDKMAVMKKSNRPSTANTNSKTN